MEAEITHCDTACVARPCALIVTVLQHAAASQRRPRARSREHADEEGRRCIRLHAEVPRPACHRRGCKRGGAVLDWRLHDAFHDLRVDAAQIVVGLLPRGVIQGHPGLRDLVSRSGTRLVRLYKHGARWMQCKCGRTVTAMEYVSCVASMHR